MKGNVYAVLPLLLLAAPFTQVAAEQLIPAGSLLQCTVSEPKLSSKTTNIGDPVLCQVSHVELYGRSVFPYGTYLVGRFEDYKDPGHFVGKGWMELKFERMVLPPDQVIPLSAKVVSVPNYPVDKEGRILGKGHPVRDIVEWSIPVLWPIDLLNLPRRGPRPVLKAETRLTLKIMDDLGVPTRQQYANTPYYSRPDPYGFAQRTPTSYAPPAPMSYAPPAAPPAPQLTVLMLRDGNGRLARHYRCEGGVQVRYIAMNGAPVVIPMELLDVTATVQVNQRRGVTFTLEAGSY